MIRDTSQLKSVNHESRAEQFNQFLEDLSSWGSYTEAQITAIKLRNKSKEPAIAVVQGLWDQAEGGAAPPKGKESENTSSIKKLLVGKMASLSRKQVSVKEA